MEEWTLSATDGFVKDFEAQSQRFRVVQRISRLRNIISEQGIEWVKKYKLLTTDSSLGIRAYRDVVSAAQGGARLLFSIKDRDIRLIGFDLHDESYDNWNRLTNAQKADSLQKVVELPTQIREAFEGSRSRDAARAKLARDNSHLKVYYPEEESQSWAFHLTAVQEETVFEILDILDSDEAMPLCFILGSAGTGKTIAMLQMASLLEGRPINVILPKAVRSFYSKLDFNVPLERKNLSPGDIVLLDDPKSVNECRTVLNNAISKDAKAVVMALDPFQLMRNSELSELAKFLSEKRAYSYSFQVAFRQRRRVGEKTLKLSENLFDVASESPKMQALSKSDEEWLREQFLSGVTFPHEGGIFRAPQKGNLADLISKELDGIRTRPFRWNWTEPVLVVWGSEELSNRFALVLRDKIFRHVLFNDPESVRGTEYQEVLLILSMTQWVELTGSSVVESNVDWNRASPIHMFLTRARDTVTILIDDERDLQKIALGLF